MPVRSVLRRFPLVIGLILWLLQNIGPAAAEMSARQDGQSYLQSGIRHAQNLDIDEAIQDLQTALQLGLTPANQVHDYYYLALMYKTEGQIDQAEASLTELLKRNIDYQLPSYFIGTDFERIFQRAKVNADREAPIIQHKPIHAAKVGNAIEIEAVVEDNNAIKTVQLVYQISRAKQPHRVEMQPAPDGIYRVQIPEDQVRKGTIQYQVSAMDVWHNIAQTPPISVAVKGSKRWGWYLGSALASIAGGIVGYIILNNQEEWPKSSPPLPPTN